MQMFMDLDSNQKVMVGLFLFFLERLKINEPIQIHGDGEQTRDFIFVKDVVSANLLL
ncbi:NAD-dependent epimerase/dehydratase family protein [Ureibacillus acetophenoni]